MSCANLFANRTKMEAGDCPTLNTNAMENYLLSHSLRANHKLLWGEGGVRQRKKVPSRHSEIRIDFPCTRQCRLLEKSNGTSLELV